MSEKELPEKETEIKKGGEEKKLRRPATVTVGNCIAIIIFSVVACFMITYIFLTQHYGLLLKKHQTQDYSFIDVAAQKVEQIYHSIENESVYEADEEILKDYILKGFMLGLGDQYAAYYNADEFAALMDDTNARLVGIGVQVTANVERMAVEIISVYPDSPADKAGVLPGDLIVTVKNAEGSVENVSELGYDKTLYALKGEEGSIAEFTVARGENYTELVDFSIARASIEEQTVTFETYKADESVGIIRINSFDLKTPEQFKKALDELVSMGVKSLIMDVRYNPGGELQSVCKILDMLVPEGPVIRTVDRDGNEEVVYTSDKEEINMPMAVLMNGNTASAAELFSSCLKDYDKAILVGENSFGKGSMQTIRAFADGSGFKFTYRYYCPPFSDNFDKVGIAPDVEVTLPDTIVNFYKMTQDEDTQLIAAYEALKKQ